jgi:hypothetical protein
MEIRTCKHGLCYPALYDWNHDGKLDLLLGEFSTGNKESNVRVYLNEGTKKKPQFSGKYFYARDIKGDTIVNNQWCCIGIHPRFVDITGDGILDMLSGQYNPGAVSLWRGTKNGFTPREYVPQEGYKERNFDTAFDSRNPGALNYWNYTSTGFADYNGDGLIDMFVGGGGGLRVALNVGTKESPKFGLRKSLYFTDGRILSFDGKDQEGNQPSRYKTYMTPVDWDGDGVLDILATNEFDRKGTHAIYFFKGVKTNLGIRFKNPQPLFTVKDGGKELPGCQPMITVGDYNGDGVKDIVMGISIPTINGYEVTDSIAWQWVNNLGIEMPGKDAGEYYMWTTREKIIQQIESNEGYRSYYLGHLKDYKYLTLRHRGYVFVFYGKKNPVPAKVESMKVEGPKPIQTQSFSDKAGATQQPITYKLISHINKEGGQGEVELVLSFAKGWHGYVDSKANVEQGWIPTIVKFEFPEGIMMNGPMEQPYTSDGNMYMGQVSFRQMYVPESMKDNKVVQYKGAEFPLKVHVSFQICNDKMCLPPQEYTIEENIHLK